MEDALGLAELTLPVPLLASSVFLGDVTGDGVDDLVVNAITADGLESIEMLPGPYVEGALPVATVADAWAEYVGDTDGDSRAEVWLRSSADRTRALRLDTPLSGSVGLPVDLGWVSQSGRPAEAEPWVTADVLTPRTWEDMNSDGLVDVLVRTGWDNQLYLAPHTPGEDPALTISYPECEWGETLAAVLPADSDGTGRDRRGTGGRGWARPAALRPRWRRGAAVERPRGRRTGG